ncbi:hypothetical protein VTL71DRAFT_6650 [Oculimacula yallundae]|uniref:Uncharacterized protein n=1 Tax=Oculimacula yallundae TaxID=86028 RepID=A0ABR4BXI1_9HELO
MSETSYIAIFSADPDATLGHHIAGSPGSREDPSNYETEHGLTVNYTKFSAHGCTFIEFHSREDILAAVFDSFPHQFSAAIWAGTKGYSDRALEELVRLNRTILHIRLNAVVFHGQEKLAKMGRVRKVYDQELGIWREGSRECRTLVLAAPTRRTWNNKFDGITDGDGQEDEEVEDETEQDEGYAQFLRQRFESPMNGESDDEEESDWIAEYDDGTENGMEAIQGAVGSISQKLRRHGGRTRAESDRWTLDKRPDKRKVRGGMECQGGGTVIEDRNHYDRPELLLYVFPEDQGGIAIPDGARISISDGPDNQIEGRNGTYVSAGQLETTRLTLDHNPEYLDYERHIVVYKDGNMVGIGIVTSMDSDGPSHS